MYIGKWIQSWPVYRQITGQDALGRGKAAQSKRSATLTPRTAEADHVAHSVCPYCAVGCAQNVYVTDGAQYFSRPGPRLVDSLEILAHALHPLLESGILLTALAAVVLNLWLNGGKEDEAAVIAAARTAEAH